MRNTSSFRYGSRLFACRRRSQYGLRREHGFLAGHVLRHSPRPARHDLVGRRADVVRRSEVAALVCALEHVLRHDLQRPGRAVSIVPTGVRRLDDDRVRIGRGELERLAVQLQQVLHRRVQRLVERHLRAEQHVFRRDRMPVRKLRALAKVKRPRQPVGRHLPRLRQHRDRLLLWRCRNRTSVVNRLRSVMSVVDVSFAIMALNVRGFPVIANTKRPPCLPSDGASTTSGSSGRGCGSLYSVTSAARRRQPAMPRAATSMMSNSLSRVENVRVI